MNVARLNLDYVKHNDRAAWLRWLLLAVALAFAADMAIGYLRLLDDIAAKEQASGHLSAAARDAQSLHVSGTLPAEEEMIMARDTIRRLAMPWDSLFQVLESSQTEGAALLAIEPNMDTGSVVLTGEARDYLHLLSYVSALASSSSLTGVHLQRHETKANDPQRLVTFSISAKWKE